MLVEAGAADWPRVKPNVAVRGAFVGESTDNSDEDTVDWDVEVRQYHRGFGRYDIPGVGIVQGRDKAIKSLQSQFGKMQRRARVMVTVEHVREELGSPSHEDISDETLARLIEEEKTLYGAASRAAHILARKYAMQCDYARGNVRESLSQISKAWRELALELEKKAALYNGIASL